MSSPLETSPARESWEPVSGSALLFQGVLQGERARALVRLKNSRSTDSDGSSIYEEDRISQFEFILTTCEPVLDYLLSHLPTFSILSLYQTSDYLCQYMRSYPLAWRTLSFRQPQPTITVGSPGLDAPPGSEILSPLDLVLKRVVVPIASRLTSLDLCNTSVYGVTLVSTVLTRRGETLQHLSVRGCKNVSLKYHLVPFLRQHKQERDFFGLGSPLALKSLYTYRCRHHRRRPYLPASLFRRDSDSEPTHELIEICHALGIWTDTAWCPTPGPRCSRRKDYHGNRAAPGSTEVWVPFDRLWRSSNRIGPTGDARDAPAVGKLWEEIECGQDGEPLGTRNGAFAGEGKHVPMHLRRSHRLFVQDVRCDDCEEVILERCETCSIKMHCMGCRKTLCSSCSYNKPYRRKRPRMFRPNTPDLPKTRAQRESPAFWWAPGAKTSPNRMTEEVDESDSETDEAPAMAANMPGVTAPLRFDMSWCCLEPLFSGGGGVAFVGTGLAGLGSERIRAVPLPKTREYLDPDFITTASIGSLEDDQSPLIPKKNYEMFEAMVGTKVDSQIDILNYLLQPSLDLQATTCPRSLCQQCYKSVRWRLPCKGCNKALCKEHDFRALKVRKCGYRDLTEEREFVRNPPKHVREAIARGPDWQREPSWPRELHIPEFRVPAVTAPGSSEASDYDNRQPRATNVELNLDVSDDGSTAAGPSTRDPSSAPLAAGAGLAVASADRSSSVLGGRDNSAAPAGPATRPCLRGRSVSMSELPMAAAAAAAVRAKKGATSSAGVTHATERMLLPCNPGHPVQWQGCGEYYCQASRGSHDPRGRCSSKGYDCLECGVYVCEASLTFITKLNTDWPSTASRRPSLATAPSASKRSTAPCARASPRCCGSACARRSRRRARARRPRNASAN
jgi:hypothetical protein